MAVLEGLGGYGALEGHAMETQETGRELGGGGPREGRHSYARIEDMPQWFQEKAGGCILRGYRPCHQTYSFYLRSLLSLHNETINIWTHVVGALFFLWQALAMPFVGDFNSFLLLFAVGGLLCFGASSLFHLLLPHGPRAYGILLKADYAGVVIMIAATCATLYGVLFHCHSSAQLAAVLAVSILGVLLSTMITTLACFGRPSQQATAIRVLCFIIYRSALAWDVGRTALDLAASGSPTSTFTSQ